MKKLKNNQKGFSALETILVLAIVVIIGVVGWMLYKGHNKASSTAFTVSTKTTNGVSSNPYAGWRTYTLKDERVTFQYPSTWKLTDDSTTSNDAIYLSDSNNISMTISDINQSTGVIPPVTVQYAAPVSFLGHNAYLDYYSSDLNNVNTIDTAILASSPTNIYATPFSTKNLTPPGSFVINASSDNAMSLAAIKNNIDYNDVKLIVESMHY